MRKPAALRQVQLALLKAARAEYVCPFKPVCDRPHVDHIAAYGKEWIECQRGAVRPGLELVMFSIASSLVAEQNAGVETAGTASQLATLLRSTMLREVVSGQLAQLAAATGQEQAPLNVQQLQYVCCCLASLSADTLRSGLNLARQAAGQGVSLPPSFGRVAPSAAALESLQAAGACCAATVLQLEPDNPKSHCIAAFSASTQATRTGHIGRAIEHSMQAYRLAAGQRNDWALAYSAHWAVVCTAGAVSMGTSFVSGSMIRAALEAHQQAELALCRCKHVLPKLWIDVLQIADNEPRIRHLQAALQGQHPPPLTPTAARMQRTFERVERAAACDGCGQSAVGLRRCARCRQAQYCSAECQRQHWKVHKRECRPA